MITISPERVREFLLTEYSEQIKGTGLDPKAVPDTFDFFLQGVIDSFGILQMVGALEKEFGMEIDMSGLEAEQLTVIGPLSQFVAAQAAARPARDSSTS